MKNNYNYCIIFVLLLNILMISNSRASKAYPVPQGIKLNPNFKVQIEGAKSKFTVPVQDLVDVCFAHFEITDQVKITVTCSQKINSFRLSPARLKIKTEVEGNRISFSLAKPQKLILLINEGAGNHNIGLDGLCIFADSQEKTPPKLSDKNVINILNRGVNNTGKVTETVKIQKVFDDYQGKDKIIYFPKGIYKSGMLHLRSKESLYLAPGAVLLGSDNFADYKVIPNEGHYKEKYLLGSWKADNIKVFGRGIINGNGTTLRLQDPAGKKNKTHNIQFQGSNNVEIRGILSINSSSWNIEPIFCDNLTIQNVKVLCDLRYYDAKNNTDGIDINKCRHVKVDDCLIWSGDDAITPKQDNSNNMFPIRDLYDQRYSNLVIYSRKCAFKLGSETKGPGKQIYDIILENVDVTFADRTLCIWSSGGALIRNITMKNIYIEETSTEYKQNHINFRIDKKGNSIRDISITNLIAADPPPKGNIFEGKNLGAKQDNNTVQYYNIKIKNYRIGGKVISSLDNEVVKFYLNNDKTPANASSFAFSD